MVVSYIAYAYDASGNQIQRVAYAAPGADGLWFTADDVPSADSNYSGF